MIALAALVWSGTAQATVSLGPVVIGRPTVSDLPPSRTAMAIPFISRDDCLQNKYNAQIPVNVSGSPATTFQIWATSNGSDCSSAMLRDQHQCVQVGGANASWPINTTVTLTARDIAATISTVTVSNCTDASTVTTGENLTLYFMALDGMDPEPMTAWATWQTTVDLLGPIVPQGVDMTAGDELLIVNIPATMDPDRQGFYVYCYPSIADAGGPYTGDAGVILTTTTSSSSSSSGATSSGSSSGGTGGAAGDAGLGGAGGGLGIGGFGGAGGTNGTGGAGGSVSVGMASCSDRIPGLTPGQSPPADAPVCATLNLDATSAPISGAANGTRYVVALAAYDAVNNIGPLSTSLCQTPEPTDTFFSDYCRAGGAACPGCGQCTLGPSSALTWPALATAALAALGFGVRRSHRKAKKDRPLTALRATERE
jgi:hypothetical protein